MNATNYALSAITQLINAVNWLISAINYPIYAINEALEVVTFVKTQTITRNNKTNNQGLKKQVVVYTQHRYHSKMRSVEIRQLLYMYVGLLHVVKFPAEVNSSVTPPTALRSLISTLKGEIGRSIWGVKRKL